MENASPYAMNDWISALPSAPAVGDNDRETGQTAHKGFSLLKRSSPFFSRALAIKALAGAAFALASASLLSLTAPLSAEPSFSLALPFAAIAVTAVTAAGASSLYLLATRILAKRSDKQGNEQGNEQASIDSLPFELQLHIVKQLKSIRDLKSIGEVNHSWNAAAQDQLAPLAKKLRDDLETLFKRLGGKIEIEERQIMRYLQAADEVRIYRLDLIQALGGLLAVQALPVLNLEGEAASSDHFEMSPIAAEKMCAPVMRGIDSLGRPFIALRYEMREGQSSSRRVTILYQDNRTESKIWYVAPIFDEDLFHPNFDVDELVIERLTRLIRHEPVARLNYKNEESIDKTSEGKSILELK